jgi:hypothetical protein
MINDMQFVYDTCDIINRLPPINKEAPITIKDSFLVFRNNVVIEEIELTGM